MQENSAIQEASTYLLGGDFRRSVESEAVRRPGEKFR
jgi:hypothetical protein